MIGFLTVACLALAAAGLLAWLLLTPKGSVESPPQSAGAPLTQSRMTEDVQSPGGAHKGFRGLGKGLLARRVSRTAIVSFAVGAVLATGVTLGVLTVRGDLGGPPPVLQADGRSTDAGHAGLDDMVTKLRERLTADPEDAEGWALLARSQVRLEKYRDALQPYAEALARASSDSQLAAEYAETRVLANDGVVDAIALDLFAKLAKETAVGAEERSYQARYYLALHQAQSGDLEGGLVAWRKLRDDAPVGAVWIPMLEDQIKAAQAALASPQVPPGGAGSLASAAPARGPTGADLEAAAQMTPAQRSEMVQGMVSTLAARLAETPDDVQGWRQLARSYAVLGRRTDAIDALDRVVKLSPADLESLVSLASALDEDGQRERATAVWRKTLSLMPARDTRRSGIEKRLKQA